MMDNAPIEGRSSHELADLLAAGALDEKDALYAQRLLRERQQAANRPRRRWTMIVAMFGAVAASALLTAVVVGLLR